jgi:membrane associated rhomboid family serine protease
VIPLRDDQPTQSFPIITIVLILANVAVYVLQVLDPSITNLYVLIPAAIWQHRDIGFHQWLAINPDFNGPVGEDGLPLPPRPLIATLITCMFLHASILHIGGNMLFLWIFGNNIEDALGKVRYIIFYFACGLAASLSMVVSAPASTIPTLGASGAIAGVLGAYFLLYPRAKVLSIIPIFWLGFLAEVRAFWVLGIWMAINIYSSLQQHSGGGVAYLEHVVGFLSGMILIGVFGGSKLAATKRRRLNNF